MKIKKMIYFFLIPVLAFVFLIVSGAIISHYWVYTPKFTDKDNKVISGSVAEYRRFQIGDHSHGVLIRGRNINNPVILFLHAGPGLSETGMMRNMNAVLEDHYTMVYFDHRGACKSFSPFMNFETVNTNQLINDIHELTIYLKHKFKKDKIIIMGHSLGAGFAAYVANRFPADYSALIGIGMPVCSREADRRSFDWSVDQAIKNDNKKALQELESVKGYWEKTDQKGYFQGMMVNKKWIGHYGGQLYGKKGFVTYVLENTLCMEVPIFDYLPYLLGMMKCGPASWEIFITHDLRVQAAEFQCPMILFTGRHDYNAVPSLVEEYFSQVKAPYKQNYWMENSAHMPLFEEKEIFQKIMTKDVATHLNKN